MKTDFHSLFYYMVLSQLQGLRNNDGLLKDQLRGNFPQFAVAYEPRDPNGYPHQYMRDKFLDNRSKLMLITKEGEPYSKILLSEDSRGERVVIYSKALDATFGEYSAEALRELVELLKKFYKVTVEEESEYEYVDLSTDRRHQQNMSVQYDL